MKQWYALDVLPCSLNQSWLMVTCTNGKLFQWNLNQSRTIFAPENACENGAYKKRAILARSQCVNTWWPEVPETTRTTEITVFSCCTSAMCPNRDEYIYIYIIWCSHGLLHIQCAELSFTYHNTPYRKSLHSSCMSLSSIQHEWFGNRNTLSGSEFITLIFQRNFSGVLEV